MSAALMSGLVLASAQGAASESGLHETLRLLDLPPAWVVVLVVLPLFGALALIGYARESISPPMRAVLLGLRMSAFVLLLAVLARPVFVEHREEVHPAEVAVLLDDSASMLRKDTYGGDEAAEAAIRDLAGRAPAGASRLELARLCVERRIRPWLEAGDYRMRLFGFSEGIVPIERPGDADGRGAGTHVGSALAQVIATHRGRPLSDIVVLSDGRSTGGLPALEAGRAAGVNGVPVHTIVVGDTRPEMNAVLELIEAPGHALQEDELAVTVRVSGRGRTEVQEIHVVLEEIDPDGLSDPRSMAERRVALGEAGERVVLVARAGVGVGERRFRVSIPPLRGETMVDDNQVEFSVHVSPTRMRVLYVDGYPRWEYRYLKNLLLRADKYLDVRCFLLSATPDFPQESSPGLPPLRSVPTTRAELLENFDVVILGDVNPNAISPDPERCEAFLLALHEFVRAGGGLLFQAGEFDNPRSFKQTPLEELLPIVLDPAGILAFEGDTSREVQPMLEQPNDPHEIVRLHEDLDVNRRLWEEPGGLRGFYWYQPVRRAKPGSLVLLRHPEDRNASTGELYPILVAGYYPSGRTIFLGIDSTWMWRYHYGDRYHETFWRNAIRWLALGRLRSGDRRYRLETPRSSYDLEELIPLEARVLDEDFQPSERPEVRMGWSGPDGKAHELELGLSAGRPGVYRGSLQVDQIGLYRAWIEVDGKRATMTEFDVHTPSREKADPSPDPASLALLSQKSGGRAVPLARIDELAEEFPGGEERREPISSSLDDAWDRLGTLLLALGLLSAEWILRKRVELV